MEYTFYILLRDAYYISCNFFSLAKQIGYLYHFSLSPEHNTFQQILIFNKIDLPISTSDPDITISIHLDLRDIIFVPQA